MCHSIANKLPGRDSISVTRHIVKRYSTEEFLVLWTPEDDETLKKFVAEKGRQWTVIAEELGRPADVVRLRYRDYVSLGENRKKGYWRDDEAKKLYEVVLAMLRKSNWTEVEGLHVEVVSTYVDWGGISQKMGHRSRLQCRSKWSKLKKWKDIIQG
jgi:Myb-like DNA-binding protein REB1